MKHGGKRPGAGRKPKYGERTLDRSISLPESLDYELTQEADKYGVSVNEIIVGNLYKVFMEATCKT